MRLVSLLLLLLLSTTETSFAIDNKYAVTAIDKKLTENAWAVKRMEDFRVEIISSAEVIITHTYAITVLSEQGNSLAAFHEWYNKFRSIVSLEGSLYDASGKLIKKVKGKDFEDESAVDEINLIDDNRMKHHRFYSSQYPYTVEYKIEIRTNQTFSLPAWIPQNGYGLSIEESQFKLIVSDRNNVKYRSNQYLEPPTARNDKGKLILEWQVNSLLPIKKQFASPRWDELSPMISLAPSEFEISGYKGNMSSWKEFGSFLFMLNKGRDQLPEDIKLKVIKLSEHATSDREKIKLLYSYLQNNTRYISVQLGIGGWQPFPAEFVSRKGYGDCKALTNFMHSLLQVVGIDSRYAIIRAGVDEAVIWEDFPSNQFNHAILCVPNKGDTIWLECTSQIAPFNYLGSFTGNRKALIIDENGGVLVPTHRYEPKHNLQQRQIYAKVTEEGTLISDVRTRYTGSQQELLGDLINSASKEKIHKLLQNAFELSSYEIKSFSYDQRKLDTPEVDEQLEIVVNHYSNVSGKRLFVVPNILNQSRLKMTEDKSRTADLVFSSSYYDEDEVSLEIPTGYKLESGFSDVLLESRTGRYQASLRIVENKIYYKRIFERKPGRYSASEQNIAISFFNDAYKADRARLVFVKE